MRVRTVEDDFEYNMKKIINRLIREHSIEKDNVGAWLSDKENSVSIANAFLDRLYEYSDIEDYLGE